LKSKARVWIRWIRRD